MNEDVFKNDPMFLYTCEINNLNAERAWPIRNVICVPTGKRGLTAYIDGNYHIKDIDVDIASDYIFVQKTRALGLNPKDFYLFEHVIAIPTPKNDFYCLMDRNFNIFWITKCREENLERTAKFIYNAYISSATYEDDSLTFPQPFSCLSLSTILSLASRIDGINLRSFHIRAKNKTFISIHRQLYGPDNDNNYAGILCLIKYLGESSEFYFQKMYPLLLGNIVDEPHIAPIGTYLMSIINALFYKTKEMLDEGRDLDYREIMTSVGQYELISKVEEYMHVVMSFMKRFHDGEISMETIEGMVTKILSILELDDKTWRQSDGSIHIDKDSLEELFDKPKEDIKNLDFHPQE